MHWDNPVYIPAGTRLASGGPLHRSSLQLNPVLVAIVISGRKVTAAGLFHCSYCNMDP